MATGTGTQVTRVSKRDWATGAELWNATVEAFANAAFETGAGHLLLLCYQQLVCLNSADGSVLWVADNGTASLGDFYAAAEDAAGYLYVSDDIDANGRILKLDPATGAILWRVELGANRSIDALDALRSA